MKQIYLICLFLFLKQLSIAQTVAHFSIDKRKGCQPLTVNFVDSSYGGTVTKRDWDLGGLPSNLANTGRNFTTAGKFTIRLTVTFSNGDLRTTYDTINVYPLPVADFTLVNAADTSGCVSHKIQLKSLSTTSTGTITKYNWDFGGGGNNGTDPTPFFTYFNPGKYNVSLIVENNFGCKSNAATKYNFIKVFPVVTASFTIKNNFSCDTFLLSSFINTTTGGDGLTYKWYFGDGDSTLVTTKDTLKHMYRNPGNYVVKLVATNASNCKGTYIVPNDKRIFVGKPKPSIICADTVCSNTTVSLTGSSIPPAYTYKWIISDHNTTVYGANPTYKFDTPGNYSIVLIASNYVGCNDTAKKTIVVKPGPVADFTMDQSIGCSLPFPVQFTYNGGSNFTFDWNFGDGTTHSNLQSPQHSYTSQGYFHVSLTVTDPSTGCSNTIQKNYAVGISIPKIDFTYLPSSGCRPLKVTVTAKVDLLLNPITVSRYIWNFGDGTIVDTSAASISHVYTTTGTFYIRLTTITSKGCKDSSLTKPVVVADLCDDDGSGDGGGGGGGSGFVLGKSCADRYSVTFTDTVKNSKTLKWDFGDGINVNTGVLNPITHNYNPGNGKMYTVTITRLDTVTHATTSSQKRIIIIDEKANFAPDIKDICKSMQVNFRTIAIDSSKIKKYTWDYGDQTPRNVIDNAAHYLQTGLYLNGNASHVYLKNGIFSVKLIIEDKLGCKDSMTYPLPIKVQGPVAGFIASPLTGCGEKLSVTFKDTTKRNGTIPVLKWMWNFGDGSPVYTTASDSVFKHIYSGSGSFNAYTVTLKVIDSIGCESEDIRVDHIKRYFPRANMYSYDTLLCGRLNVNLYNSSYAYNASYLWDLGDGTTATTYHVIPHTYTKIGLYTIKLVVTDQNNCKDSITRPAYVKLIKPKADFIIGDTSQCAPTAITFKDASQYAISYHWFFDGADGGTDKDPSPHIYGEPGYYKVTLAIKGVNDCVDTISKIIHIKGPIAKLNTGSTKGCVPYAFHIGVSGTNIKSYAWDFGDGTPVTPSTDSAVNHVYLNSGKYLPNAILTSPEGCTVTLKSKDTVIVDELHADFVTLPYQWCDSATVQFTDHSIVAPFSSITKTEWIFGDGSTTTGSLIGPHTYKQPGTYTVSIIVSSKYGCVDTLTKKDSIHVWKSPAIAIKGDSLICLTPGSLLHYQSVVNSTDSMNTYQWSIDNVPVSTDQHLTFNVRTPGSHELKLRVMNSHMCSAVQKKTIFIDSIKANFSISAFHFCGSGTVELKNKTASASAITKSLWNMGNGTSLNSTDVTYTYTVPGSYNIKLVTSNAAGCSDSMTTTQPVQIFTVPKSTIVGDSIQCHSGAITFKSKVITTDSITSYQWFKNAVAVDSTQDLSAHFNAGNHTLQLIVKTKNGCQDTIIKNVTVDSIKADFDVLTPYLCDKGDTAKFNNLSYGVSGLVNYQWDFGDGTFSSSITPVHAYANPPGTYTVGLKVKSKSGCTDSLYKIAVIQQYSKPVLSIQSNKEICKGQELLFKGIIVSNDTIQFMQWTIDSTVVAKTLELAYTFAQTGMHKVTFSVLSKHGCAADTTTLVNVHPLPVPVITKDTTVCSGTSVQLNAHDGINYSWLPVTGLSNPFIANPLATPDTSIKYRVFVKNQFGCTAIDSVTIKIDKPVKIKVKEVAPICNGETIMLYAWGNTNLFKWTPALGLNNPFIANPQASPTVTTKYTIIGLSLNVCPDDSASVTVTVGEIPDLEVTTDTAVVAGSSIQINSSVNNVPVSYFWKPSEGLSCSDCPNPFIDNIREDKLYTLTVTSQYGCKTTDTIRIRIFCEDDLLIPNAFTPNDDGLNDIFFPQAPGYGIVKSMAIFNRWGEMVFSKENFPLNDPVYGWNGTYGGNAIEGSNVFVYVIRLRCANGSSTAVTGKVTLIR